MHSHTQSKLVIKFLSYQSLSKHRLHLTLEETNISANKIMYSRRIEPVIETTMYVVSETLF